MFLDGRAWDVVEIAIIDRTNAATTAHAVATCGGRIADVSEWVYSKNGAKALVRMMVTITTMLLTTKYPLITHSYRSSSIQFHSNHTTSHIHKKHPVTITPPSALPLPPAASSEWKLQNHKNQNHYQHDVDGLKENNNSIYFVHIISPIEH